MENSQYNLMTQLIQEQKSLWRIEKHYIAEAASDEEKSFWERMHDEKSEHVKALMELVHRS
jgi:hypothetical protein